MKKTILIVLVLASLASCTGRNEGNFHITGTIEGAEGKYALVCPVDKNDVFHGDKPLAKFRIRNGRVDAYISLDSTSVYEFLVPSYKGTAYAYVPFFAESPELYVSYSKDERGESGFYISSQSTLNAFYRLYCETKKNSFQEDWAEAASMARDDNYFTKEYKELSDRCYSKDTSGAERDSLTVLLSKLELSGEMLTPEGQAKDSLSNEIRKRELDYDKAHLSGEMPTLATLYLVTQAMKTALALNHDVSFWLSHYDEVYRDGFIVVGAAREFKDSEWRKALAQDAYPWVNLIALGEGQSVWTLYGIPNAAGGRFLIGPDGTILKINPTPEEVEASTVMFQLQMQE
jgi:hypothetical protein